MLKSDWTNVNVVDIDMDIEDFFGFDPVDQEIGRDTWKGLGKENCGVPQGTAFGPLLASAVLGHCLRHLKTLISWMTELYLRRMSEKL
jgi:hypothetical protein